MIKKEQTEHSRAPIVTRRLESSRKVVLLEVVTTLVCVTIYELLMTDDNYVLAVKVIQEDQMKKIEMNDTENYWHLVYNQFF